jgi:transglutaminase-like putative cysteine protease
MTVPPFLLGLAFLFWGWQAGAWVPAGALAVILESPRFIGRRFDLSAKDFSRISDFCALLFLGLIVYRYVGSAKMITRWAALPFVPLILAQVYSVTGRVDLAAIFWSYRRRLARHPEADRHLMDLRPYFFVLVLMSASAANTRSPWFYAGLFLLVGYALWPFRPKTAPIPVWIGLVLLAGLLGYGGHIYLNRLHMWVQDQATEWFADLAPKDPFKNTTAFGEVGRLQLSDRTLFRVGPEKGAFTTLLLREASYTLFRGGTWTAAGVAFTPLSPSGSDRWTLGPSREPGRSLEVFMPFPRGKGSLALPAGSSRITGLAAVRVTKSKSGSVRVEDGPGFSRFQVEYGPGDLGDEPPGPRDLTVPPETADAVNGFRDRLGLAGMNPETAMAALQKEFGSSFRYTLDLGQTDPGAQPIPDFLLNRRAGHCEHFASASVFLLRAAGIPARYATGYLATEYSRFEKRFIIRSRHAHAWVLVFDGGLWRDFDPTPAVWPDQVAERAPVWEGLADLLSWLKLQWNQFRWTEREGAAWSRYLGLALAPPFLYLAWRLRRSRKRAAVGSSVAEKAAALPPPGLDSEFYRIEAYLAQMGRPRWPSETMAEWLVRIQAPDIVPLFELHQRLRFDPLGLSPKSRADLAHAVADWLDRNRAEPA